MNIAKRPVPRYDFKAFGEAIKTARKGRKESRKKAQRRDAILNAALKEFALRGYDDASTNVIAREAGISKALIVDL